MFRASYPLPASHSEVQVHTSKSLSTTSSPLPGGPMCEDGRPYVTDPITGRQVCLCNLGVDTPPYGPPRPHGAGDGLKPGPLSAHGVGSTPTLTFDPSAFYPPLIRGLPLRQDRLPPYLTAGMPGQPHVTFDPVLASHPYGLLYAGVDMAGNPMRKAATRETTGPLKAWLSEHKKNPYPTKAEKIMLAIITRMTLTQVSTWFANARRRLKKENKLFPGDRDDKDDDDDDDETTRREEEESGHGGGMNVAGPHQSAPLDSDSEDINVDSSDNSEDEDPRNRSEHLLSQDKLTALSDSAFDSLSTEQRELLRHRALDYSQSSFHRVNGVHNQKMAVDNENEDRNNLGYKHRMHPPNGVSLATHSNPPPKRPSPSSSKPKIWSISEIIRESPSSTSEMSETPQKDSESPRDSYNYNSSYPQTPTKQKPFSSKHSHTPPMSPRSEERYQTTSSNDSNITKLAHAHVPRHYTSPSSSKHIHAPTGSKLEPRHPFLNSQRPPDFPSALWGATDNLKLDNSPLRQRRVIPEGSLFVPHHQKNHEAIRGWMAKNEDYIIRSRNVMSPDSEKIPTSSGQFKSHAHQQHSLSEVTSPPRRKSIGDGFSLSPERTSSSANIKRSLHSPDITTMTSTSSHADNPISNRVKSVISSPPTSPISTIKTSAAIGRTCSESTRPSSSTVDNNLLAKRSKVTSSGGKTRSQIMPPSQNQESGTFKKVPEQDSREGEVCVEEASSS